MASFDFFRARRSGYVPRSPASSLKAIRECSLAPEHFLYGSTSAKPLDEEPYDLDLIGRVLSRKNLTIETRVFIKSIFEKLIHNADPEKALFGAEGITAIEARSIYAIEASKSKLEMENVPKNWKALARHYHELAAIHGRGSSMRTFYLKAAYESLRKSHRKGMISRRDLTLLVDILVSLGLANQAEGVLRKLRAKNDPFVLFLAARVAFHRSDYWRVVDYCRRLVAHSDGLSEKEKGIIDFWVAGSRATDGQTAVDPGTSGAAASGAGPMAGAHGEGTQRA